MRSRVGVVVLGLALAATSGAAQDAEELAKKLANPVASLISFPLQLNTDLNLGPDEGGERTTLNVQPVIPISISEDWNLIARIITPIVYLDGLPVARESDFGLGDMTPTFFFSPKEPTSGGLIWGVGPVFLLPTATEDTLGADQWCVGPSALALTQKGPWTLGALVNHLESVAGDDDRPEVSSTFLQPFVAHNYPGGFSWTVNTESSYDWNGEQWTVPVNLLVSQVTKWGKQPISLAGGPRFYLDAPDGGPEWGLRLVLTLVFPK